MRHGCMYMITQQIQRQIMALKTGRGIFVFVPFAPLFCLKKMVRIPFPPFFEALCPVFYSSRDRR